VGTLALALWVVVEVAPLHHPPFPLHADARSLLGMYDISQESLKPLRSPYEYLAFFQLPYTTSWQDLKDQFRLAGNVIRADILLDTTGRSKGQGTVLFESPQDAQKAIRAYFPSICRMCILSGDLGADTVCVQGCLKTLIFKHVSFPFTKISLHSDVL